MPIRDKDWMNMDLFGIADGAKLLCTGGLFDSKWGSQDVDLLTLRSLGCARMIFYGSESERDHTRVVSSSLDTTMPGDSLYPRAYGMSYLKGRNFALLLIASPESSKCCSFAYVTLPI